MTRPHDAERRRGRPASPGAVSRRPGDGRARTPADGPIPRARRAADLHLRAVPARRRPPSLGEQVAWGESNAIAFCNSVLGARTNRYGDFIDIAAAITGRVPDAGLHRTDARRATLVLRAGRRRPAALRDADVLFPVLGIVLGRRAGSAVAAIDGLPPGQSEDRLKAIGAAAASSGSVAMFHVVGSTPGGADARRRAPAPSPTRRR